MNATKVKPTARLQNRRPLYDPASGDKLTGIWPLAILVATERARETGVRQVVSLSPYRNGRTGGAAWRVQAWR